jgi:hypothetical protein
MKLPEKKQKELEKKGKRTPPPAPGGGALGRLRQFEQERGLPETKLGIPVPGKTHKNRKQR